MPGHLGRHVQLVAQLAEVGDPDAQRPGEPEVDLARGPETERLVRQVHRGERGQQLARARPLHVQLGVARRDVGDGGEQPAVDGLGVPADPGLDVPVRGVRRDHPEPVVGQLGHGQIGLQQPGLVQPLGVGDHTRLAVHPVRRQLLQQPAGVATLDQELGHERHVHQGDPLAHRPMLVGPVAEPARPAPGQRAGIRRDPRAGVPVGSLPAADVAEAGSRLDQPVVNRRALHPARGLHRPARVVALVHLPERLHRAGPAVLRVGLVAMQPVDVQAGDVDVGAPGDDPVRQRPAESAAGQDADRVQPGCDEVVPQLGRLADHRRQVGGERLGAAEELPHPQVKGHRHPAHRLLQVGPHPVPVRRDLAEREVGRSALHLPRRALSLEQPDHQTADLFAVVAERGRILQHRQVGRQAGHLVGDQVVVLGGLQRHAHAGQIGQLARPQPGTVHHVLALDLAGRGAHPGDRPAPGQEAGHRGLLDDPHPAHPGALGQRHRDVDRVDPAVLRHVEPGQHVVGAGQWEQPLHLAGRDLLHVHPAEPVERRDPAVLLQPVGVGGDLDEADRLEPGGLAGLRLQPAVELAAVLPELGRGLRRGPERHHQPGRVPGGARGDPVPLQQHHVLPARLGQVVGHRTTDHAAAHHHHPRPRRDRLLRHPPSVLTPRSVAQERQEASSSSA